MAIVGFSFLTSFWHFVENEDLTLDPVHPGHHAGYHASYPGSYPQAGERTDGYARRGRRKLRIEP